MRVLEATAANVALVAELLGRGEVAAIPTETVYGLAGAATSERALARIFAAKDRPVFDPLIVHVPWRAATVDGLIEAGLVDAAIGGAARGRAAALLAAFAPGPLTLVLPRGPRVPDLATSGLPTVGLRSPRHPVTQALLQAAGPLAAPSANRFGRISPTSAADVVAELSGRVEVVLDGGPCAVGLESTIVQIEDDGGLRLLRPGGVAAEAVEAAAGVKLWHAPAGVLAPGMLPGHYAPRKRLRLLPTPPSLLDGVRCVGLLAFDQAAGERLAATSGCRVLCRVLGPAMEDAARGLFAALRWLDASEAELILAEPCPTTEGLGHAILDRLARAAQGSMLGGA